MTAQEVFHRANEVTMFLAPLLGVPSNMFTYPYVNNLSNTRYINAYLSDSQGEVIKILTYGYRDKFYHKFKSNIVSQESYLFHTELEEGRYDIWTFSMPERLRKIFNLFEEGKYSSFPEEEKIEIVFNTFLTGRMDIISRILEKDTTFKKLREQELKAVIPTTAELWSLYDVEKCSYNATLLTILENSCKKLKPNECFFDKTVLEESVK